MEERKKKNKTKPNKTKIKKEKKVHQLAKTNMNSMMRLDANAVQTNINDKYKGKKKLLIH